MVITLLNLTNLFLENKHDLIRKHLQTSRPQLLVLEVLGSRPDPGTGLVENRLRCLGKTI